MVVGYIPAFGYVTAFDVLIVIGSVSILVSIWRWRWRRRRGGRQVFGDELQPLGDPTRYALAAAILEGAPFRRRVMDIAEHPYRARAPELGLDFNLLLAACVAWERQDRRIDWAIVLLLAYALGLAQVLGSLIVWIVGGYDFAWRAASTLTGLVPVAVVAAIVTLVVKAIRDERRLRSLSRDRYDAESLREQLGTPRGVVPVQSARDNVICYGTRKPFVGLGERIGGWQVAIEMDRARGPSALSFASNGAGPVAPATVQIGELLAAMDRSVSALAVPGLEMRFPLFVSGTEVGQLGPKLLADPFGRPASMADAETLGRFWFFTDPRARSYRCYMITDWNGELVFSYLLRFVQRGQSLGVETAQLVLAPVSPRYRRIDAMRRRGLLGWIMWLPGVIMRAPFTIWSALMGSLYHLVGLVGLAGYSEGDERREVSRNPAYNYGARVAIRETIAAKTFNAHFQLIDGRQYFAAIDQRVLNALIGALDDAGIDVSSLRGQAQVVLNGAVNLADNSISINNAGGALSFGNVGAGAAFGPGAVVGGLGQVGIGQGSTRS